MKRLRLYMISQDKNNDYDTYDAAVVAAYSAEEARTIHPNGERWGVDWKRGSTSRTWVHSPDDVKAELVGTAARGVKLGVVCYSYNAG